MTLALPFILTLIIPNLPQVMESIMGEFREAFKHAKGYGHGDSEDMNQVRRMLC